MADTNLILILWYTNIIHKSSHLFHYNNGFVSLFTITEMEMLLVGSPYGLNKILMASNK